GMYCSPRPGPNDCIPIWFGGHYSERLIRRVATLGDGWLLSSVLGMTLEEKAQAIATLKDRFSAAGRDPSTLEICDEVPAVGGSVARSLEQVPGLAEIGVTVVRLHLRRFASADQAPSVLEEIVRGFEPFRQIEV
ncbi:MAG: LLM class flavin-dependent oxidoreductase, partial [Chloroflexota bacterium]|nr:LLM class flavin-dependent oxidoreductase [Chloroflexota bacterium]